MKCFDILKTLEYTTKLSYAKIGKISVIANSIKTVHMLTDTTNSTLVIKILIKTTKPRCASNGTKLLPETVHME